MGVVAANRSSTFQWALFSSISQENRGSSLITELRTSAARWRTQFEREYQCHNLPTLVFWRPSWWLCIPDTKSTISMFILMRIWMDIGDGGCVSGNIYYMLYIHIFINGAGRGEAGWDEAILESVPGFKKNSQTCPKPVH